MTPHAWDDPVHRTAIHTAFEIWSVCYEQGNRQQADKYWRQLEKLTANAAIRERALQRRESIATVRQLRERRSAWSRES